MASTARLQLDVDAKGVVKADAALDGLEKSAKKATKATKKLTSSEKEAASATKRLAKDTANLKSQVAGLVATYLGLAAAVRAVSLVGEFEEASQTVKAIGQAANASADELGKLAKQTRELGASTRFTATQVAEAQVNLLRAGLASNEVLATTANVLNLATAAQLELARAAEISAITLKQFGLAATQSERVVDVLVATSNSAATTVEQLAEGMKFAAPVAAGFGASIEETAAALGVLSNAGLQASLAGTGLRGIFARLAGPTGMAADRIELLASASGQLVEDFDTTKRSLREIFVAFKRAEAGPEDLLKIFGRLQAPAALALTRAADELGVFEDRLTGITGEAQTTADTINDTLKKDVLDLEAALTELVLTINEGVGPSFRDFVQFTTEVVRALASSGDEFNKFSTAAKLAATAIEFLTLVAGVFVALKLVAAIGAATQAIFAMIVALRAMKVAIASTGIGLLVVGLGIAVTAALEFSGAFDDATESTNELQKASRKLAEEEAARERLKAQQAANARTRHQEDLSELDSLDREEKKLQKERDKADQKQEAASKRAATAAKKRREELVKIQAAIDAIEPELDLEIELALLPGELAKQVKEELKLVQLVASRFEIELAAGGDLDTFIDQLRGKLEGLRFTEVEITAQIDEVLNFFDRVTDLKAELEETTELTVLTEQATAGLVDLGNAAESTERQVAALAKSGQDQTAIQVAERYKETIDAVAEAAERARVVAGLEVIPEDQLDRMREVEMLVDRIARAEALAPLIASGTEAQAVMEGLAGSADRSASALEQFEQASTVAIEGYRAQMKLADADTEALAAQIAMVGAEFAKFEEQVARQELFEDLESVVTTTTNAFFDLFETLIDGSKTAGEAFAAFIKVIIKALFEKFVVEQTIEAIQKGLKALSNIGDVGGGISLLSEIGSASADGNVFDGGQVQAFRHGGIINGPTLFPLGLAGEAGPEAILPLARGPNGQLGVQTSGAERTGRRPGSNPFILRSLSPGASNATTAGEVRTGTSRTTNVQFNVQTPDASSFRKSARQLTDQAVRSAGFGN